MRKRFIYLFVIFLTFISCKSNPLDVDVSEIDVEIDFYRFDQELFAGQSPDELSTINSSLLETGGELYEFYTIEMLRVGSPYDDSIGVFLNYFVKDTMMKLLNDNIQLHFGDFKSQENEILNMFKHLKYHIPHSMIPKDVIIYNSTFANGVISTPNQIGLGLEMYLGVDNEIIQKLPYPEYFKNKMSSDYLMADIAQSWLQFNVLENQAGEDFLSHMIYHGKLLYIIDAMLPKEEANKKIRYSKDELEWAEVSEYNIWQHIVEQNWIYSKDIKLIVRYFNESPTTVGLEGSPARIGQFLGWKIVKSYMQKNPEVTIIDLIAEKNQSKLLKAYKPKEITP